MPGTSPDLLEAARSGEESAFEQLVEPHRSELHAHCYRMLGSVHDAEEALQEAFLRAWRGLARFEGRSSLRSWLYTIATNTCLNAIARRPDRVLPIDYGPPADPHDGPAQQPVVESTWVEPYPDDAAGLEDVLVAPDARYELRESVELAFVAALQLLPPNQRAALIMREVLGFSAQETADSLETSIASVNSALQRARKTVDEKLPEQSQQATLRALGDERLAEIVESFIDAMGRGDVDAVIGLLAEDAAWSMPPLASWFRGHDALRGFLAAGPLSGNFRWRRLPSRANGQLAIAAYTWHEHEQAFLPFALDVLTLREDGLIRDATAFIVRSPDVAAEDLPRYPDLPPDPERVASVFGRFGLPSGFRVRLKPDPYSWSTDRMCPAGSLNHASCGPGPRAMPLSSWSKAS